MEDRVILGGLVFINIGALIIFIFGCHAVNQNLYVTHLPQGVCDFQTPGVVYDTYYGSLYSSVVVENVTLFLDDYIFVTNVEFGPPPRWNLQTQEKVKLWIASVQNTKTLCHYDATRNTAWTAPIGVAGWITGIVLALLFFSLEI